MRQVYFLDIPANIILIFRHPYICDNSAILIIFAS